VTIMVICERFVNLDANVIDKSTIVFSQQVREWCKLPYPGYPNGCPNYGKNPLCPPNSPYRADVLCKNAVFTLVTATFDIVPYAAKTKELHPEFSDKQARNSRLWQSSIKRMLSDKILNEIPYTDILGTGGGLLGYQSAESGGVDMFATFQRNSIPFDKTAMQLIVLAAIIIREYGLPTKGQQATRMTRL